MNNLEGLLNELENNIVKQDLINPAISKSSVGWHIEHALLTLDIIIENIRKSTPEKYRWKFNFIRTVVLIMRKIPRGKAQSPDAVVPKTIFTSQTLREHLSITRENVSALRTFHAKNYFEHPMFGKLNLKPAIKFLAIHTKHHLKIINDIVNK